MAAFDFYKDIDFDLEHTKPEYAGNEDFKKILKDICAKKNREEAAQAKIKKPMLDISFNACVVIMGLPQVEREKSKLLVALFEKKLLPKFNIEKSYKKMELEFDENGNTTGSAIMEFDDPEKAIEAAVGFNNMILPPSHKLTAMTFKDFEDVLEKQVTQSTNILSRKELSTFHQKNEGIQNLNFVTCKNNSPDLTYYTFNTLKKSVMNQKLIETTNSFAPKEIFFSESGNYLIAMHDNFFEIYGGSDMTLITSFYHRSVKRVIFSKNENYVMSYSGTMTEVKNSENLIVWNFYTGQRMRVFKISTAEQFESFRFSHSEKYLSGIIEINKENLFCVYELPSCALTLDPVSGKRCQFDIQNPMKCVWAPFSDHIMVICGGEENAKSSIAIYNAATRKRTGWISITFSVISAQGFWSYDETFVIVKMNAKIKKKLESIVHIGTIDLEKNTSSVSILDSIGKAETPEIIVSPNGNYFVLFTPQKERFKFEAFAIEKIGTNYRAKQLYTIINQNLYQAHFCPFSKFMILGDTRNAWFTDFKMVSGKIEFKLIREIESAGTYGKVHWSPCGRFVAFVKQAGDALEASIFDCYGRACKTELLKECKRFSWRTFSFGKEVRLDRKTKKEIKDKVIQNYDTLLLEDEKVIDVHKATIKEQLLKKEQSFLTYIDRKRKMWEDTAKYRVDKLGYDESTIAQPVVRSRINKEELIEEMAIIG